MNDLKLCVFGQKFFFWSTLAIVTFCFILISFNILIPFFIAAIIAYMLQPFIKALLNQYSCPSVVTISIFLILLLSSLILLFSIFLPILYEQVMFFMKKIPFYKTYIENNLLIPITEKIQLINPLIKEKLISYLNYTTNNIILTLTSSLNNIWKCSIKTLNIFFIIFLTPIIIFYFSKDWEMIINEIKNYLPLKNRTKIIEIITQIDKTLAAYIRGQINICLILSIYYSSLFYFFQIDFSILLGLISGISIIIPFLGIVIISLITIGINFISSGFSIKLLFILITYFIGILLDSYFFTPKMIGKKIGLHPLWIIFSVLILGKLLGFFGIIFAIPITGILRVLFINIIELYKVSRFYNY